MCRQIDSHPYRFPLDARLDAAAVLVIDMQVDFCGDDGYMARRGGDMDALRAPIEPIRRTLAASRARGLPIIYTREAFSPDLHDLQAHRRRAMPDGLAAVGAQGVQGRCLVHGEPGWAIIDELAPAPKDQIYDKPGYGVFAFTDIESDLRDAGITNLVLTGVTTDCCVHTILREALDRGFDCLTLSDCCAAGTRELHEAALRMLEKPSGTFGALSTSAIWLDGLEGVEEA